jgi:hypothetical protein
METVTALRPLLENLIDYAGLFPPSALPMSRAIENYQRYRESAESWMLARFVVPVSRLDEFEATLSGPAPPLSALIGADLEADLARIARARLPIDTIELKVSDAAQIDSAMRHIQAHLTPYLEITDPALIPVIQAAGGRAKIRTGGVTPEAFPSAEHVARFIETCARHRTAFKATAGLHHPLRCHRPLTYSSDGPSGWMFGFLNVFIAATLARKGHTPLEPVLLEERFDDHGLTAADFADTRRELAISFGSCSFEEPVADLRAMNLL